jgi:hypothetical protein
MKGKKKQAEINELLGKLQRWENDDLSFMTPRLKVLRHNVMNIHFRMEVWLELTIGEYLLVPILKHHPTGDDWVAFQLNVSQVIEGMDFVKKLSVMQKTERINTETANVLHKVNRYRVIFSHPASHLKEILELEMPDKYSEVLKTLVKAYETFDMLEAFNQRTKELEKELENK